MRCEKKCGSSFCHAGWFLNSSDDSAGFPRVIIQTGLQMSQRMRRLVAI